MILIPALAIPMPLLAQAYGNLFLPALAPGLRPGDDALLGRSPQRGFNAGCAQRLRTPRKSHRSVLKHGHWSFMRPLLRNSD